jgi:antirestriction protein ArdC
MPNVYEIVTENIIKQLESGVIPWRKPWRTESPVNLISQKEYRGINVFLLGSQGYGSRYWLTFNQAKKLGGHVQAGAKSTPVVFWHIVEEKTVRKPDGTDRKSKAILLRYYSVFNLCQTDGIAEKLGLDKQVTRVPSLEQCESIVAGMPNPPQREQSARAWYRQESGRRNIGPWTKRKPASLVGSKSTITAGLTAELEIAIHTRTSWLLQLT